MNSTLFPDKDVFQKERPTTITEAQENEFFQKMAAEIISNGWSRSNIDVIASDLKELYPFDDGFEMAKDLEGYRFRGNYNIDSSFVEWLEGLDSEYAQVIEENVRQWVKAHDIQPKLQLGQKIKLKDGIRGCFEPGQEVYVGRIYLDTARYVIRQSINQSSGYIIAYDKVEGQIIEGKEVTNG